MRFRNGLPRQCVPQGHLLRGAHWLAMTGIFDSLTPACVSMRAFLQPISARIYFGKTASRLLRRMFSYARRLNGRSFFMCGTSGRCGISPYGRFAAPLCRAGPTCPAGINAYCAAGHMGPALRIILRPLRCRASPTGGRRGGRPCPPEQREALSFRASDRVTGVGIRFLRPTARPLP